MLSEVVPDVIAIVLDGVLAGVHVGTGLVLLYQSNMVASGVEEFPQSG